MKEACDAYFYLPARQEHRGTGGIFFDDLPVDEDSLNFVKQVVTSWMPSWKPIVTKHVNEEYTEEEKTLGQQQKMCDFRHFLKLVPDVPSTYCQNQ